MVVFVESYFHLTLPYLTLPYPRTCFNCGGGGVIYFEIRFEDFDRVEAYVTV